MASHAAPADPAPGDIGSQRFPIRVDRWIHWLLAAIGAPRRADFVDVTSTDVAVQLGWAFRARIARAAITGAHHHPDMYGGWGAHGWRGRWLVNGSSKGIVEVTVEPATRARLLGVVPVQLGTLYVSVIDPDALIATLSRIDAS